MEEDEGASPPNTQEEGKHFLDSNKTKDDSVSTPLKLQIDQILHVIKHQPWVRLSKLRQHDSDFLEAGGHCSFHES